MEYSEALNARYGVSLHDMGQRLATDDRELAVMEADIRKRRAENKKLRAAFFKAAASGPDPQKPLFDAAPVAPAPVLPEPVLPTPAELLGTLVPKSEQLWRKRHIREMTDHIPLVNALYGVPLETIGALYDFLDEERSLIAAGGFGVKLNKMAINAFVDYCEAHPEIDRLLNVERLE